MLVDISYKSNLQFQATARGHVITSDQPYSNGGEDTGMTPPELFLAALGSCVGFYAVKYCQTRGLDATSLNVKVSAQKTTDPPIRLDDIEIHLSLPISLSDRHQKGLENAVNACLIHTTLTHPPRIMTQIDSTPIVAAS
ncbi:osmotically inducible protein OsmC [Chroococcidiopsis sp. CCALA 051]|uniref:OsmC family protein n=1 Tax=Chroococcidiopsis sp. CCALA 051 TaxID=869949 RepID=UPI000D0D6907|nr:OsmC family protein [Chroococcidiopsis sp. CCALA 051]MBE9014783.1 OsmC family protein [Chroococcidiopsidales cyanobacterium LEGE 13417]PSM45788.1 osmotically inducible protein OsmC [Chroococcidiopsis sp. CCALA 051]